MRILQLCNKPPYPPIDGGAKAMHTITRALLAEGHQVKVLCISTNKNPLQPRSLPKEYVEATAIDGVFVDISLNVVDAFTDLITADNYNVSRFFSPDMDIKLIRLLSAERFDAVLLESLFMTPYIPTIRRYSQAPIVLRSHNLEHVIQERIATGERNILKKPYRRFLARQLRAYEMDVLDRVDGVAAITPADAAHFREHGTRTPIVTVPFGVDPDEYAAVDGTPKGRTVFFHLGSMDWLPNEEGIRWLLNKVWPRLLRERPEARLHLAGNKMPDDLLATDLPGVRVNGRVKDALKYMADRHVMVVPLFSAGGMRVKIIEGMAMGKTIISTPVGAEGVEHTNGHDILLARTASDFIQHMKELLDHPERIEAIGEQARALVLRSYSDTATITPLVQLLERLVRA
jgi:glycosyltransferase involved in cell wall biosynthesis